MRRVRHLPNVLRFALILGSFALVSEGLTSAQTPPPVPPAVPPAAVATPVDREAQLENRIRQLEQMVDRLADQVNQQSTAASVPQPDAGAPGANGGTTNPPVTSGETATPDTGNAATTIAPAASGGAAAPGQSLPPNPSPSKRFNSPATLDNIKGNVKFGPGFEIRTNDDEYILQLHNLTQFDYRGYQQANQNPVRDSFLFPRQWFMASGRLTKPFGYFISEANGFDALSILDCFVDIDYDPRLRFRLGRFKTPFTYEFFVEPVQGLVVPERSLFFNNFALNRDLGAMAFGRLAHNKLDYAVGIFNGNRNGFVDNDNNKDIAAFMNYRPWGDEENTLLENFNIGGSVFAGNQQHSPTPVVMRTIVPTAGNSVAGVPFLTLNNNVINSGERALWDLHVAWFYKQLAVIAEWGSGFESFAIANTAGGRTRIPVQGFYAQGSYLLTGETRSSIGLVKPFSPFDIRKGKFGTGAWEPFVRYESLNISKDIFTSGLADPNLWTNSLYTATVGVNWHLTQYVKMYFDWNHAVFGNSVLYSPGHLQKTSDMFLVRFQLFF